MKKLNLVVLLLSFASVFGQETINVNKNGFAADGYDVVAYFDNTPIEGQEKYKTEIDGVKYQFSSEENLQKFKENPEKYIPQYGGWCAYAISLKNQKVEVNPKTFEIADGKLYLFYNAWGTNTLKLWQKEGAEKLRVQADKNWDKTKAVGYQEIP